MDIITDKKAPVSRKHRGASAVCCEQERGTHQPAKLSTSPESRFNWHLKVSKDEEQVLRWLCYLFMTLGQKKLNLHNTECLKACMPEGHILSLFPWCPISSPPTLHPPSSIPVSEQTDKQKTEAIYSTFQFILTHLTNLHTQISNVLCFKIMDTC